MNQDDYFGQAISFVKRISFDFRGRKIQTGERRTAAGQELTKGWNTRSIETCSRTAQRMKVWKLRARKARQINGRV